MQTTKKKAKVIAKKTSKIKKSSSLRLKKVPRSHKKSSATNFISQHISGLIFMFIVLGSIFVIFTNCGRDNHVSSAEANLIRTLRQIK